MGEAGVVVKFQFSELDILQKRHFSIMKQRKDLNA
jgi:hypothetical protein